MATPGSLSQCTVHVVGSRGPSLDGLQESVKRLLGPENAANIIPLETDSMSPDASGHAVVVRSTLRGGEISGAARVIKKIHDSFQRKIPVVVLSHDTSINGILFHDDTMSAEIHDLRNLSQALRMVLNLL